MLRFLKIFLPFIVCCFVLSAQGQPFRRPFEIYKEIRINVPSRTLQIFQAGRLIKEYPVGVGVSKKLQTPPGVYKVINKVIDPIWEHPYKAPGESRIGNSSKNPLGTRWIGFHKDGSQVYGIHGTNSPSSVGKFVSHGCVRMHNRDVEELFDLIDYETTVRITYSRFYLDLDGSRLTMEIFPDPYKLKGLSFDEIFESARSIDSRIALDYEFLKEIIEAPKFNTIYEIGGL